MKTSKTYTTSSASLAFLLWGGWALYINYQLSGHFFWVSALAQGSASFGLTLIMVKLVQFFYLKLRHPWAPPVLTATLTTLFLALVHFAVGTPHILSTIAPASSVGFLFCIFTSFKIHQLYHSRVEKPQERGFKES